MGLAIVAGPLAWAAPSAAQPASECVRAANQGQTLRDQGKLLSAREELALCSRPQCPKVVATECRKWLEEVSVRIPSVVVALRDASGADVTARILVDGKPSDEATSGRALLLDPGPHLFRAESDRGAVERSVVVRERESGLRVLLALPAQPLPVKAAGERAPAKAAPSVETSRPVPTFTPAPATPTSRSAAPTAPRRRSPASARAAPWRTSSSASRSPLRASRSSPTSSDLR